MEAQWFRVKGKFTDYQTSGCNLFSQESVFLRINPVKARTKDSQGFSAAQSSLMRYGINTSGQTTCYHQSAGSQFISQFVGQQPSIGSRVS